MIVLREFFIAKPGQAGKLANIMKQVGQLMSPGKMRVLTNETGEFNRVEMETEFATMEDMLAHIRSYPGPEEVRKLMVGYADLYQTGGREILNVR